MMLRFVVGLFAASGYPAFIWWIRVRYSTRALVLAWLGASLLAAAPMILALLAAGETFWWMWAMVPANFAITGLVAWTVARGVARYEDPPIMIPLPVLGISLLYLFLGGVALSVMLISIFEASASDWP